MMSMLGKEVGARASDRTCVRPHIVAIGGTTRPNSSTEKALRLALVAVERLGATSRLLGSGDLDLPMYAPERPERAPAALRFIDAIRSADGIIIGSPAYHGSISGLIKNAIEYVEDLSKENSPYLEGRPVGIIATGAGWQGAVQTVSVLRSIVHSLRGWPTPLGVAINTAEPVFDEEGRCISARVDKQLESLACDVVSFARWRNETALGGPQSTPPRNA